MGWKQALNNLRAIGTKHSGNNMQLTDALLDEYFNALVEYANDVRTKDAAAKAEFNGFISGPLLRDVFLSITTSPLACCVIF